MLFGKDEQYQVPKGRTNARNNSSGIGACFGGEFEDKESKQLKKES